MIVYDNSLSRVGIIYTMIKVSKIDPIVSKWIRDTPNLDRCRLSKKLLLSFGDNGWEEKGIGLKYRNVLGVGNAIDDTPTLSLKAWYGSEKQHGWEKGLELIKDEASISSIRWRKGDDSQTQMVAEWYNYGKVTVGYADDIDYAMQTISSMARRYYEALNAATKMRDEKLCAFELNFSKTIDIDAFAEYVKNGRAGLKLWMIEVESSKDFKRFRGVDLHTWDPIYLDLSSEYAFLTIPMGGCVNAAPRIAVIQGENVAGDTEIFFNGDEVFV